MNCTTNITKNIYYVGGSDRRIELFENIYPLPCGVSYNSYLVLDEKNLLMDTVDKSISDTFFENVDSLLQGKPLDYLVISHLEPDHSASLEELLLRHSETKIVLNKKTKTMLGFYTEKNFDDRVIFVEDIKELSTGKHKFSFIMAPMIHWPEVMMTYEKTTGTLFSADAFGTFGALSGNVFADKALSKESWKDEMRRYYCNIVGKYGQSVQSLLKKAEELTIKFICPLHGPVWRRNLDKLTEVYRKWSAYESEDNAVSFFVSSIYGNTANAVDIVATELDRLGLDHIKIFDLSKTHVSEIIAECFRTSNLIFAGVTYNAGLFPTMAHLISEMKSHNVQNKSFAVIENGSWAPLAGNIIEKELEALKNMRKIADKVTINGTVKKENKEMLIELAKRIYGSKMS